MRIVYIFSLILSLDVAAGDLVAKTPLPVVHTGNEPVVEKKREEKNNAEEKAPPCGLTGAQYVSLFDKAQKDVGSDFQFGAFDTLVANLQTLWFLSYEKSEKLFQAADCAKIGGLIGLAKQHKNFAAAALPGVFSPSQVDVLNQVYSKVSSLKDVCDSDRAADTAKSGQANNYGYTESEMARVGVELKQLFRDHAQDIATMPDKKEFTGCAISEAALSEIVRDIKENQLAYRLQSVISAFDRDKVKNKAVGSRETLNTCMEIHRFDALVATLNALKKAKGASFIKGVDVDGLRVKSLAMTGFCDGALTKSGGAKDDAMLDRNLKDLSNLVGLKK